VVEAVEPKLELLLEAEEPEAEVPVVLATTMELLELLIPEAVAVALEIKLLLAATEPMEVLAW
jgi:hypothetical protein